MKTGIYARVSTRDRGQDTENQLRSLREFAVTQNWTIVDEYVDNVSASGKVRRPEFERLMADATDRRFDMVLFWSLDRLSREGVGKTVGYLDKLTAAGVGWRSFTEQYLDSCGIFKDAVLAILAVIAKQERIRISERTIAGLATARAKGRVGGRKPKDKDEDRIRELKDSGLSLAEVALTTGVSRATVDRVCRKPGFVYVMACGPLLRVGFSSNPNNRLYHVTNFDVPHDIEGIAEVVNLLSTIPGDFERERYIHHEITKWACCGSWYVDCEELRVALRAYGFTLSPTTKQFIQPKTSASALEKRDRMGNELKGWV